MSDALRNRIAALEAALKPLADIADEYDADGLEECRPSWVQNGNEKFSLEKELYAGRGGKQLLTLGHAMVARLALTGKAISGPTCEGRMVRAERHFKALNVGNVTWEGLPQQYRDDYAKKLEELDEFENE